MEQAIEKLSSIYLELKSAIDQDWQLQGCIFGAFVLGILLILINIEWGRHGCNLMNLEVDRKRLQKSLSTSSKEDVLYRESFSSNVNTVQSFPDEDPLTFVKKRI